MPPDSAAAHPTQTPPAPPRKTAGQRALAELRSYAEALLIAFLVVTFVFNTVGVVGSSMRPNLDGGVGSASILQSLLTGDRVFIPKYDTWLRRAGLLGPYRRGEVVVVREPANSPSAQERSRRPFFIKRVIGVPGDRLRIEGGQVFVNDHPVDQGFITATGEIRPDPVDFPVVTQANGELTGFVVGLARTTSGTVVPQLVSRSFAPPAVALQDAAVQLYYGGVIAALEPIPEDAPENTPFVLDLIVPEGHYFVMGDNRDSRRGGSEDSRYFGPVPAMSIAGKATAVIWPPQRGGEWNWRALPPPAAFAAIPEPIH
jgi:signal peptidase I